MDNVTQNSAPTFESLWQATLMESRELQKETDRLQKENALYQKELDKKFDRLEKMIERTDKQVFGISNSNGMYSEEYFVDTFRENPVFLGETYDHVLRNLYPDPALAVIYDEYDLVMRNGSTLVIMEIKYKAVLNDVRKMFRKLETYRANYPMFKDYKTYLCLAAFSFAEGVRERAAQEGIVLIHQKGEVYEILNEDVRTW